MRILLLIIMILLMSNNIYANDIKGGRQIGMAGTVILSKPSAHSLLTCPTGSMQSQQFAIESVAGRKYGLADLDEVAILASYRYNNFSTAFGFSRMGTPDYYTEKTIRNTISYHYNSFTASLITSGKLIEIGLNGKLRAASVGLGASYTKDNYYFGLTVDDLNKPKIAENIEGENMKINLFAEIDGDGKHSVTSRLVIENDQKPLYSIGQFVYISKKNGLFWGISFNPLKYGGGFELEYNKFYICYGLTHHPVLGFSHNISISFITGNSNKTD